MPSVKTPPIPTFYNHAYYPISEYALHNLKKYQEIEQYGGLYAARAIACSSPEDVIQLDPRLRSIYPFIVEHLEMVGLKTAATVIYSDDPGMAKKYPDYQLSVYRFNDTFHAIRPDADRLAATELANDKNSFMTYCATMKIPIPPTYVSTHGPVHDRDMIQLPALVKAARSSAGISIYRVADEPSLINALALMGKGYQIQEEIRDIVTSISVQYRATDKGVKHVITTDQLVDGFSHFGNTYPSVHTARHITDSLAQGLQATGLRDIFGLDVAVTPTGILVIECNARWTDCTYQATVAKRLGARSWMACTLPTRFERPQDLKLNDLLYDQGTRSGVVVTNLGLQATHRKLTCLLIGNPEVRTELQTRLKERLQATPTTPLQRETSDHRTV